mgnify:CR=1 FL=1
MIEEQTPGIYPSCEGFPLIYNYANRQFTLTAPNTSMERYMSVLNPTDVISLYTVDISDDLFKAAAVDFFTQVIGAGFIIASATVTAFLAALDGLYAFVKEQSVDEVENATLVYMNGYIYRGSTPPPKDTPLSLNELHLVVWFYQDESLTRHTDLEGKHYYECTQNRYPTNDYPALDPGSVPNSYVAGDCVKYLKRGFTGESPNDYGYVVRIPQNTTPYPTKRTWESGLSFENNEKRYAYNTATGQSRSR